MLNVRKGFLVAALALTFAPLAHAGDDDGSKAAPTLDVNAMMQKKLSAKLNGQLGAKSAPAGSLDDKLSERVDEQKAEAEQQLDEHASALTAADRGEEERKSEAQDAENDEK